VSLWRKSLNDCHFTDCHFTDCHFTDCHFTDCHFTDCHFTYRHFTDCHFTYRHFTDCHFIVYKGGEETSCVCRRLLSKSEYPFRVAHQHFIVEQKEGETGLLPERPRARVCVRLCVA
jgi:hypothetical protein